MQEINFNNRDLSEFSCVITEPPKRPFPKRKYEKISVPGRNGDLILDDECYENISLTYKVETIPTLYDGKDIDEVLTDLKAWLLSSVDYQKLYDTELPEGFNWAFCSGISDAVKTFDEMYEFNITFDCKPFFYLDTGQIEQTITSSSISLYNEGNYKAYPKIKIIGSGQISCYVNGKYFTVSEVSPNVIVDSEEMLAYSSNLVDKSDLFSGIYPTFATGANNISFVGAGFQSAVITTRWCNL